MTENIVFSSNDMLLNATYLELKLCPGRAGIVWCKVDAYANFFLGGGLAEAVPTT